MSNDRIMVTKVKIDRIGNAIREKTGNSNTYTLDEMPEAIRSIETGGGGGVGAQVTVTTLTPEFYGKTVFLTNGVNTMSTKFSGTGIAVFTGVEWEGELTVYINYENVRYVSTVTVKSRYATELQYDSLTPWATATDAQIAKTLNAYYNGVLSLEDIQTVWHVGDERTVSLSAMSAAYGLHDVHRAQDVKMVILDFEHDDLTAPINEKTKALITIQQKDCLMDAECAAGTKYGESNTENCAFYNGNYPTGNGWGDQPRRYWLDDTYYNALPSTFKSLIKDTEHIYIDYNGDAGGHGYPYEISEKVFLPADKEMDEYGYYGLQEGTQYEWYKNTVNRRKLPLWESGAVSSVYGTRTHYSYIGDRWVIVSTDGNMNAGNPSYNTSSHGVGLAPAMCL